MNPHPHPGKPSDLPPRHLPYLDGWRGMAIAAVLAGHFLHVPFVNMARLGVELSFQTLVLHGDYYAVYWRTDTRASSILLACGLFLALHKNKALLSRLHPHAAVWLVMIGFLLNFEIFPDTVKYTLGTACFALAISLIDQAPPLILNLLSQKLLVRLGLWSFSVYLWQEPFNRATYPSNHFLKLVGLALCSLASFYLVEQPARRFLNTRWKPSPKNVARPAATIAK